MNRFNRLNLMLNIPQEIIEIPPNEFQSCACFDHICDNSCRQIIHRGELGAGIGGTVSKVYNIEHRTTWAKKVLRQRVFDRLIIKKTLNEIEHMKRINSDHVVSTFGGYYLNNEICLFMEHMDIGSLGSVIDAINYIPERFLSRIAKNIVNGLIYLYDEAQIVHYDLKPGNILLNKNGEVKLCDFGISDDSGFYPGTIAYMSPQRLRQQVNISEEHKADIWSLGITLLHLATGDYPMFMLNDDKFMEMIDNDPDGECRRDPSRCKIRNMAASTIEMIAYFDENSPDLSERFFSRKTRNFIKYCLIYLPENRFNNYNVIIKQPFLHINTTDADFFRWLNIVKRHMDR